MIDEAEDFNRSTNLTKLKVIKKRRALMNKIIKERKEIITETTRTNNLISL